MKDFGASADRCVLFACLVPVAFGKWGSYLAIPPGIYLSDVLLALGVAGIGVRLAASRDAVHTVSKSVLILAGACAAFGLWQLAGGVGPLLVRARDVAPFLYLACFPFVATAVARLGAETVTRALTVALSAHACWSLPVFFGLLKPVPVGWLGGQSLFLARPDIDCPLLAALIVVLSRPSIRLPRTALRALLALTLTALVLQPSRAGLTSALLILVVSIAGRIRRSIRDPQVGLAVVGGVAALLAGVLTLPNLPISVGGGAFDRLGITRGSNEAGLAESGAATRDARQEAWSLILTGWRDSGSIATGLGAGTEIVQDTGALLYLSGDPRVRAPHNWWVHVLSRFGVLGTLLYVFSLLRFALVRWRQTAAVPKVARGDDATLAPLGLALAAALLVGASIGVLVEAPFGSYPLILGLALFAVFRSGPVWRRGVPAQLGRYTAVDVRK